MKEEVSRVQASRLPTPVGMTSPPLTTAQQQPPPTRADPMSLSSIMSSGADPEPPAKSQQLPPINPEPRRLSRPSVANPLFVKQEAMTSPAPADLPPHDNGVPPRAAYEAMPPVGSAPPSREIPVADEAEVDKALAKIETTEMNDLDVPGFDREKEKYIQMSRKRALDVDNAEAGKRKVVPPALTPQHPMLTTHSDDAWQP